MPALRRKFLLQSSRIAHWLDRLQPSSASVLFVAAVIVGLGTGVGAVLFIRLIGWVEKEIYIQLPVILSVHGRWWFIAAPTIGGLIAGPIIAFFSKEAKGHGVPEVMEAIALHGGRIRPRVVVAKVAASSACIGSGGSAGREGPIVQVGAAFGSTLAQFLHFSETRIRNLVACGAAAGIAATFNAPIAGVLFAIEIILGEMELEDLGSIVLSAITASTVARALLGNRPAFDIPTYALRNPWEILLYLLLGLIGALVGVVTIKSLYYFEDKFDHWRFPDALKPGVGGLILGLMGYLYPQVLGVGFIARDELRLGLPLISNLPHVFGSGFPVIEGTLLGHLSLSLLLILALLKTLATSLTLGSGNSGGVFAPTLFTGAMIGGAFGWIAQSLLPNFAAGVGAYATVGMAAVFAAAARAPLTAILIVFEMTDDYRILLPLMGAVIISTLVAQNLLKESIYTLKLVRKGINLFRGRDMDVMSSVLVSEAMDHNPITVKIDVPARALAGLFLQTNTHGFPVLDQENKLWGIVSLEDYRRACADDQEPAEDLKVRDIATRAVVSAYPDESVRAVLQRMAPRDISRVPVVARDHPHQLLGVVKRNDIVHAYELGMVRRGFAIGNLPGTPEGTASAQFPLGKDSPLIGKSLSEIRLPDEFLVIHIHRNGTPIMPHGNTCLHFNDVVTLLTRNGDINQLENFWKAINKPAPKKEK